MRFKLTTIPKLKSVAQYSRNQANKLIFNNHVIKNAKHTL